jgi:microcystin-dependent protein
MKKLFFILLMVFSMSTSYGQVEAFLGEIKIWSGNYAPRGWAFCEGQMMQISQNAALYSLLGTTYGGNGQSTFALPDLRGRIPVGVNQSAPGLTTVYQGQVWGSNNVTIIPNNLPIGIAPNVSVSKPTQGEETVTVSPVGPGSNFPILINPPSLGIRYIICITDGIYPTRD